MTTHADDVDLGLADLAPVEPPEGLLERLLAVAVDPSTPPVDDSLIPAPGGAGGDDDEVDLADLDDDPGAGTDAAPSKDAAAEDGSGPAAGGPDVSADPDEPLTGDEAALPESDPLADLDPAGDPAAEHGYGDETHHDTAHDDPDPGV